MNRQKLRVSYDQEGDVLTLYRTDAIVSESIEVTEELIIDLDKDNRIVNLELLDAYNFLHTLNEAISKEMLATITEAEVEATNYRNYWILSLAFEYHGLKIEERLPAFAGIDYQSPLLATASA